MVAETRGNDGHGRVYTKYTCVLSRFDSNRDVSSEITSIVWAISSKHITGMYKWAILGI